MIDWRTVLAAIALASLVVFAFLFGLAFHRTADDGRPTATVVDVARSGRLAKGTDLLSPAVFARSRRAAILVWGGACGGHVVIRAAALRQKDGGADILTLALSRFAYDPRSPLDSRQYGQCSITVNTRRSFSRARLCATIVHEWGHLTGHGHVKNRRSIMYPSLNSQNFPDVCR